MSGRDDSRIEAAAVIGDPQLEAVIAGPQPELAMASPSMFGGIVQRLLRDPIEDDLHIRRNRTLALHRDRNAAIAAEPRVRSSAA